MQIFLRLAETKKKKIRIVENYTFTPRESLCITLVPVPSFLENPKCECGKPADFMLEDMICICRECLNINFKGITSLQKNNDISIPLTKRTITQIKFEWSVNGSRWYTLYGRNVKPKNWDKFLVQLRTMMLRNKTLNLNADYTKETKEMVIF